MRKSTLALAFGALGFGLAPLASAETPLVDASPGGDVAAAALPAAADAVVSSIAGSALVSQDGGIVPLTEGMNLQPLNRIFVLEASEATLVFADGCAQTFGSNAVVTLSDTATCVAPTDIERVATSQAGTGGAAAGAAGGGAGAGGAGAAGAGAGAAGAGAAAGGAAAASAGVGIAGIAAGAGLTTAGLVTAGVVGVAAVGGGVAVAAGSGSDDDPPPAAAPAPTPTPPLSP